MNVKHLASSWLWRPSVFSLLLTLFLLIAQAVHLANPLATPLLNRLDYFLYDSRFALLLPQRPARAPIVIVDLDEASIQREGRWPWDRNKVTRLVTELQQDGTALIGLDMIFSEAGNNAVDQVLATPDLSETIRRSLQALSPRFDGDTDLANAISHNTVLGYLFHNDGVSAGQLPFPFYQLPAKEQSRTALLSMENYTASLPLLANHAFAVGFVVAVPDMDGVVRRVPLVIRYQDGVYASLALQMAQLALGAPWLRLHLVDNRAQFVATSIDIGDRVTVPLDANGSLLVPYRGPAGSFPTISATRVMRGDISAAERAQLQGAIVLVGTSAKGLSDLRTTPLQTGYPGVEIHANILDSILQAAMGYDTFYVRPDWAPGASLLMTFLSGLLLALMLPGRSPLLMLTLVFGWLVLVVSVNLSLWQFAHLALPMAMPLLLVLLLSAFNISVGFFETNRNKREIQNLFGEYVPPAYVARMVADPQQVSHQGEQRQMTVLFADVCSFTTMSESLTTTELKSLLNRYLTEVTRIIFRLQGTIDKYVGDMVMAFWNAPLDDAHHAEHGVLTALAIQQRMVTLREEFVKDGLPAFRIGIGLNTGPMNVGDMGSNYRRAYTVLGDAVNLGSRLEGLTRFYGVDILVSEDTQTQASTILYRRIDRIQVKGKHEPVEVSEPVSLVSEASDELLERVANSDKAIALYRAQQWAEARSLFSDLLAQDARHETFYRCYLERIDEFERHPPNPDWDATFVHTSK